MLLFFFFTLIPKIYNPMELRDFGPISLVGCIYKLLAKIPTNRLKSAMLIIIGPFQEAFVEGRQIHDRVLIANKLIDSRKKSKKAGVIFKVDIKKAYDHVERSFVDYMSSLNTYVESMVTQTSSTQSTQRSLCSTGITP